MALSLISNLPFTFTSPIFMCLSWSTLWYIFDYIPIKNGTNNQQKAPFATLEKRHHRPPYQIEFYISTSDETCVESLKIIVQVL